MTDQAVEAFIRRWQGREGGQERANYALFLSELTDVIGAPRPEPAAVAAERNDYVFERVVREVGRDGAVALRRIDLYRRSCFVLEAKQSRQTGQPKELFGAAGLDLAEPEIRGRRGADRAWDVLMLNARRQAENYVRLLPRDHEPPPFVIVCDVGHCLELYANFRRDGKAYDQFPDRAGFRIYLEDLRRAEVRDMLAKVWIDPGALDPSLKAARVTRDIAARLAGLSRRLEAAGHDPEEVAQFLMRVIFTMFAEDVELIPRRSFKALLEECVVNPNRFAATLAQAWEAMDAGGYAIGLKADVKRFNGSFFRNRAVIALGREEIGELLQAAAHDWRNVEPAIFGTLLEQALDPAERRRLGAHYTPRAHVERLVIATVIEPLRADWSTALATAERQREEGRQGHALKTVRAFHDRLCATRVLDPACGTANFLYVTLELLKRLEGEVLEALANLGGQEALAGLEGHTVDPSQLLGLEANLRAAAIAELVLWIGFLQWHARTRGGAPEEPILKAFRNIVVADAVLTGEWTLRRDETGRPATRRAPDGAAIESVTISNPRRPAWPAADFIVGNPPFIGGKDLRARLGDAYATALWRAHPHINESADYVMYWWDHAAELLTRKQTALRRFGFVTTNSIAQVFQRRIVARHLQARPPISIVIAIPDHPWTKVSPDSAAVRVAMTVAEAGARGGALREVVRESGLDTDAPAIEFAERRGVINADLTVGADAAAAHPLLANEGLCSRGVSLHGAGFIVSAAEADTLGRRSRPGLAAHVKPYRNGRDLTGRARGKMVIDLFGLTAEDVRARFPEVYRHLLLTVQPERAANSRATYRTNWWIFGEPRAELRPALSGLRRYIATVETAKHRVFQFLDATILPDNMLVAIASDDAFHLGVLSSKIHVLWALRAGGRMGIGNDPRYSKSRCFNPFPFPDAAPAQRAAIRALAEELDGLRKQALAEHPDLTLTQIYNVLERLRAGAALTRYEQAIGAASFVTLIAETHDRLNEAVARAYGWAADLDAGAVIERLLELNARRAAEEAAGEVRWLRPRYQAPRLGRALDQQAAAEKGRQAAAELPAALSGKPAFPRDEIAQTATVMMALMDHEGFIDARALAGRFKDGRRAEPRIAATLQALARLGAVASAVDADRYAIRRSA